MLWLIFALLTGAAVLSVLWPLARTPRGLSRGAIDVASIKRSSHEIDRGRRPGLVAESDAEGAKAEARPAVCSRLLTLPPSRPPQRRRARRVSRPSPPLFFVPALTLGL